MTASALFVPQTAASFIGTNHATISFINVGTRKQTIITNGNFLQALPQPHDLNNAIDLFSSAPPTSSFTSSVVSTLPALPTLLTSVKVFDGSEIVDSVVVSNSYWSTLASSLPLLILAQALAAITFVVIASVVASQGKFIIDQVSSNVANENVPKIGNRKFRKLNDKPPPTLDFSKLLLCIFIDILGSANEAIPLVGELVDVIYAPIAALLLRQLFFGSNIVFLLEFAEEILPFTDVLPLATICWVVDSFFRGGNLARALKIGNFAPNRDVANEFIDLETKKNGNVDAQFSLESEEWRDENAK